MADELFHCVCRTCVAETVTTDVAGRAGFFEEHADHEVVTEELHQPRTAEPQGRVIVTRAGD